MKRPVREWIAGLAAAMTLVAGLPHFHCRCPDGRVKLFCLGPAGAGLSSCCAAGCCTNPTASVAEQYSAEGACAPCCCGDHEAAPGSESPAAVDAGQRGCVKTPAPPLVAAAPGERDTDERGLTDSLTLPESSAPLAAMPNDPGARSPEGPVVLPPPDLVTLLGRLLI